RWRQIGDDGEPRAGTRVCLAERELERRREAGRRVERLERFEPRPQRRPVGRPALRDVWAIGGGDEHRLVDARAVATARELEARAARLARLHAGGDVEDEDERRPRRWCGGVLEIRADVAGDQRE